MKKNHYLHSSNFYISSAYIMQNSNPDNGAEISTRKVHKTQKMSLTKSFVRLCHWFCLLFFVGVAAWIKMKERMNEWMN